MKLHDWYKLNGREALESLAKSVKKSPNYLSLVARGHRTASPKLAIDIDLETNGEVPKEETRPDIFGDQPKSAA